MEKTLLANIDRIHTTELGVERIRKNLGLDADDPVAWCREKIRHADSIDRKGKNWYVFADNVKITVNAHSYTIITAHKERRTAIDDNVDADECKGRTTGT